MQLSVYNNRLFFAAGDGSNYSSIYAPLPSLNQWHHIVAQRVGNNAASFKVFVNGQPASITVDNNGLTDGDIDADGVEALKIGSRIGSYDASYLKGDVRQVRLYRRLLDVNEILASYNNGCTAPPANTSQLVLWSPLDDGTGTTVKDLSSYNTTGTFTGSGLVWNYDVNYASCVDGSQSAICLPGAEQNNQQASASGYEEGNVYDYGFRIYNPRLAKFLSVDPLTRSYPMLTPYQFASNTPIAAIDLDGLEALITIKGTWWKNQIIKAIKDNDIERASYLAFKAISTTLDDIEFNSKAYAKADWKGNNPGTYNWSEKNPKGLTVVFDGNKSTTIFSIVENEKASHWYSDTFIEPIVEAFTGAEGGGFAFFTSDDDAMGIPIGYVRKGRADGLIDIKPLMDAIGASKDAATNGPADNILEGIGQIITA